MDTRPSRPSLDRLFDPRAVAVVGASQDPSKWGHQFAKRLLRHADRRKVFLVNRKRETILGVASHASLLDLPEVPEVVVLCVPPAQVVAAVEDALRIGTRLLVCITAGFGETGAAGRAMEHQLLERIHRSGARLVGPNCVGLFDAASEFHCTAFWDLPTGRIAIASQSGGLIVELGAVLPRHALGVSRAISLGNQADVTAAEAIELLASDANSDVVAAYIEDFRDGRALLRAFERVAAAGKRGILLAPGAHEAVRRAVSSHTGSLLSSDALVDSACRDIGLIRVRGAQDLLLALRAMSHSPSPRGPRVGVLADGGGAAALGVQAVAEAGLEAPGFSEDLRRSIAATMPPGSGVANPVDRVGLVELAELIEPAAVVAASGEVDAILLNGMLDNVSGSISPESEIEAARRLRSRIGEHGVALAVATRCPDEPAMDELRRLGVVVTEYPEDAARALRLAVTAQPRRPTPTARTTERLTLAGDIDYFGARELFAGYGVRFMQARRVSCLEEALAAATALGYPIALKALGSLHKSDGGGVKLALQDRDALSAAFDEMQGRLRPPEFSVERMAPGGAVELLVGGIIDPTFGPIVMVGLGGVFTEVLDDTVSALAPVDRRFAREMLLRLRGNTLLRGFRGRPPVDLESLAATVESVSALISDHDGIAECEINPVLAYPDGVYAVDARIVHAA